MNFKVFLFLFFFFLIDTPVKQTQSTIQSTIHTNLVLLVHWFIFWPEAYYEEHLSVSAVWVNLESNSIFYFMWLCMRLRRKSVQFSLNNASQPPIICQSMPCVPATNTCKRETTFQFSLCLIFTQKETEIVKYFFFIWLLIFFFFSFFNLFFFYFVRQTQRFMKNL